MEYALTIDNNIFCREHGIYSELEVGKSKESLGNTSDCQGEEVPACWRLTNHQSMLHAKSSE